MLKKFGGLVLLVFATIIFFALIPDAFGAVSTALGWTSGGSTVADFTGAEITMKILPLFLIAGFVYVCGRWVWSSFAVGTRIRGRKAKGKKLR